MRTYDLSPLFRSTIGFDRLNELFDHAFATDAGANTYPPYNIEKVGENAYSVTLAVAGFQPEDIEITYEPNKLIVQGRKAEEQAEPDTSVLYRGIATRAFERRFDLADHVEVSNASLANGLLRIDLKLELPEAMKPRRVPLTSAKDKPKVIDQHAA